MLSLVRILGIDPGLDRTGYGIIDRNGMAHRLVEAGLIRTKSSQTLPDRLAAITRHLQRIISEHKPGFVAVEDLYSYYKTPKPAILMGHVRGVVLEIAARMELPVASYMPTRIKQAVVGAGHATKLQVARLVQTRLGLKETSVPPDVTDALAVALCHSDSVRPAALREGLAR